MREPRQDSSPLGVSFKILDEPPHLFYIRVPREKYLAESINKNFSGDQGRERDVFQNSRI